MSCRTVLVVVFCVLPSLFAINAAAMQAQTFTTIHDFNFTDGAGPTSPLVQATDGNLYGTAGGGGVRASFGTAFRISPTGTLTTLHKFNQIDGSGPYSPIQAADGNLYGTTYIGGTNGGFGTVYKMTLTGVVTTLHTFRFTDGSAPCGGLVQAADGNLYGTTSAGGAFNQGTIFKITTTGIFTLLHSFNGSDGAVPVGNLVEDTDGSLYGQTKYGGTSDEGTVFRTTASGEVTTLFSFDVVNGSAPAWGLTRSSDGEFYGSTGFGGAFGFGIIFRITSSGDFTLLHSFNQTDGYEPETAPLLATDGNLYGTTIAGGTNPGCIGTGSCGTLFRISPSGSLTTLITLGPGTTGSKTPGHQFTQHTNGNIYGVSSGGSGGGGQCFQGCGTIFRLSEGLGAFVRPVPEFATIGTTIRILGTKLTNSTSVTFNGTAASFTVVSPTFIKATVPAGATTGPIVVTTPFGTLTSKIPFEVVP